MTVYDALYAYVPERWQRPFWRLYFGLTPHLGLPIPIARLRGPLRPHGRPGAIAVAGRAAWLRSYLSQTLFLSPPTVETVAASTVWGLPGRLRELRETSDVVWALLDDDNAGWALRRDHLLLPSWVDVRRPVSQASGDLAAATESMESDLRILRREKLRVTISRDPRDLAHFHTDFHLPTVRARHGEHAFFHNLRFERELLRGGFLLWVEKDGERIAASMITLRDGVLKLHATGLRGGDHGLARRGGHGAIYHFICQQARELGAHTIDLGGCRPFLTDGVLRYKRKWGGTLGGRLPTSYDDLGLSWARFSPAVADLLGALPVIHLDHGRLSALSCLDAGRPATTADAARCRHVGWLPGLRRFYLISRHGWQPGSVPPPDSVLLRPEEIGSSADCLLRCRG
jgi:hypothetical protein